MTITRSFNESVFSSYSNLQGFFKHSDSIENVLKRKNKPFTKPLEEIRPNLIGKWRVCQIASAPIRLSSAYVLNMFSIIMKTLGLASLSKRTKTLSANIRIGFNVYNTNTNRIYLIKKTRNAPNSEGKIVNSFPFILESKISDPKVKDRTFCSLDKGIRFEHKNGICRGMSYWFIYLYLKTKNQFTDPRIHMAALGKQFSQGGGMDATLLQSISLRNGKLLNLKIGTQSQGSHEISTPIIKKAVSDWSAMGNEIIHQLQNLPVGAYTMFIPCHAMVYIKINQKLGYFFDPNQGILEINGEDQGRKLNELFTEVLNDLKHAWKDLPSFYKYNRIEPVILRA